MLNGLFSLIKYKFPTNCDEGFGRSGCDILQSVAPPYEPLLGDRDQAVDNLSLLLTSGRLSDAKRLKVAETLDSTSSDREAFEHALQLVVTTPEFHTTSIVDPFAPLKPSASPRPEAKSEYKAVIHLLLDGGVDSFNVLVPSTSCGQLREEYDSVRGKLALKDEQLLPLASGVSGQPCSDFSIHAGLPFLQQLYTENDLLFAANVGVLDRPCDKQNYQVATKTQLFAHNSMVNGVCKLDPFNEESGTGVLGRMAQALQATGMYSDGKITVDATPGNLAGNGASASPILALNGDGIQKIRSPSLEDLVRNIALLNGFPVGLNASAPAEQSGAYGNVWSSTLVSSLTQTEELYDLITEPDLNFNMGTSAGKRFKLISQLVDRREERGVDRDFFFVTLGGYDTHNDVSETLDRNFAELNEGLGDLVTALKLKGVWDDTVIIQTSDFGRTLAGNSGGGRYVELYPKICLKLFEYAFQGI